MCALAQSPAAPPPVPANWEVGGWAQDQSENELAVPSGTWQKKGGQEGSSDYVLQTQASLWGGGQWVLVFFQAPEHGGRHALLLQPHLWGEVGKALSLSSNPKGGPAPPPPPLCRPLTIGLKVHLILVLILAQLNLLWVGLLRQLSQLLPGCVTPGVDGGRTAQLGLTTSPTSPGTSFQRSWPTSSLQPCPHLTNRILFWALGGWSRSASAASCSARCSSSFMSSIPLCPGARSDTGGRVRNQTL